MEEILEGMAAESDTSLFQLGYRDATRAFTRTTAAGFAAVAADLSARANRTFLVCLDELDSMLVNCRDDKSATEILDFITHVSNMNMPIRFVFTLTRATPQIMRADATPFITASRIADLAPWTERETREFIARLLAPAAWRVDDSAYELLYAEGGGHPYLTKAILQHIVDAAGRYATGGVISADQVHAGVAGALATQEVHLTLHNLVTVHFSADELLILERLSDASEPLEADEFSAVMPAFSDLCRRHYVRPAGDRFVLAFGLLGRWLLGQAPTVGALAGRRGGGNDRGTPKLVLDENRRRVFLGDREIQLSQHEYRFLQCLVRKAGTVVDRETLAAAVWPDESGFDGGRDQRISQLVHRLRTSLGNSDTYALYIETRRGFGFSAVAQNVEYVGGS